MKSSSKRLRFELGEWMRCGREVLNEANANKLEQLYLKMAERSIKLEARDRDAFAMDAEMKEKLQGHVTKILLDARSNSNAHDTLCLSVYLSLTFSRRSWPRRCS